MNFPTFPGGAVLRSVSVLLVLGGCLNLSAVADAATLADAPKQSCRYVNIATIPVKLHDLYATVEGDVHGQPSTMLLGTGSEITVLTANREAADKMTETGATSDATNKERKAAAIMRIVNDLTVGAMRANRFQVMLRVLDDKTNAGANTLPFDAELGANLLFSHDVELSLAKGELKFFEPSGCDAAFLAYWDENAQSVELNKISSHDRRPLLKIEVNGKTLSAVIDAGTRVSTITLQAAARLGITPQSNGVVEVVAGSTTEDKAWLAPFESFKIGDEVVGHPKIRIADYWQRLLPPSGSNLEAESMRGLETDMVLGADFLRAHHVLLAVSQQRLYFTYAGGKVFADGDEQKQPERAMPVVYTEFTCALGLNFGRSQACSNLKQTPVVNFDKIKL